MTRPLKFTRMQVFRLTGNKLVNCTCTCSRAQASLH